MNMRQISRVSALVAMLAAISACSHFDPDNGSRVENNVSQQRVDSYAGFDDSVKTLDGQKAEKLLKGYRNEKPGVASESLIEDMSN